MNTTNENMVAIIKQTTAMSNRLQDWQTTDPENVEELLHTILAHIQSQEYTIKMLKDALRQLKSHVSVSHVPH